jgi:deferrochelatase/peroxidase EfeB
MNTGKAMQNRFIKTVVFAATTMLLAQSVVGKDKPTPSNESFYGEHQAGISSPPQLNTYFIAFDVVTSKREELIKLLKDWTMASAEMTSGPERFEPNANPTQIPKTSGASVGLSPTGLSITFGFGRTLFDKDGVDRFGLARKRPDALVDLPVFPGDQLVPERTGGDLSVQASANDPQVVEYAVRRLAKLANNIAVMKWAQTGFNGGFKANETGRNQMGFKDGTLNIPTKDSKLMNRHIWVGEEGPEWMRGGSYMVIRPIRISLEHWDDMTLAFQEETVGRHKSSGAPIGKQKEFEDLELNRTGEKGKPIINEYSHSALSAPENNGGTQILRRAFAFDNGITRINERWPPWRQLVTFDAGLLFICYQRDPGTGFIKLFTRMAQIDMLNQFTTHTGSALFAVPHGAKSGGYIGQDLFQD